MSNSLKFAFFVHFFVVPVAVGFTMLAMHFISPALYDRIIGMVLNTVWSFMFGYLYAVHVVWCVIKVDKEKFL